MNTGIKFKLLAAIMMGMIISGCGGGGGDDDDDSPSNSVDNTSQSTPVSSEGAEYLNQTHQNGQIQSEQSQIVAQKSANPAVKELAQQVSTEINIINQQITNISRNNNVTINNNLTVQQQTQINNLNNLSGAELDRTYLSGLVTRLREDLARAMEQVRQGSDVPVRQNAAANVLLIEQRLLAVQEALIALQPTAYLMDAFEDGLLEIQLGKLALDEATNDQVREFAQHMIDEHTEINAQITALAQQKNVSLPTSLGPDKQEIVILVSAFSGVDFDKAYMDRNVMTHAEDVRKTNVAVQQGTDLEVRTLAGQSLPLLQQHLQEAIDIDNSIEARAHYQLSQSIVSELQFALLAQARTTDTQTVNSAQEIANDNRTAFAQIAQLSEQNNRPIPLFLPPEFAQSILQLPRAANEDNNVQIQNLIDDLNISSLQITQFAQSSSESGIRAIATSRLQTLQERNGNNGNGGATGGNGTTGGTDTTGDNSTNNGTGMTGGTDSTGDTGTNDGIGTIGGTDTTGDTGITGGTDNTDGGGTTGTVGIADTGGIGNAADTSTTERAALTGGADTADGNGTATETARARL